LKDEDESAQIASLARTVFTHFVENEQTLGATLKQLLTPDFALDKQNDLVGFVHRKFERGAVYFVANTSNQTVNTKTHICLTGMAPELWDPFGGKRIPLDGTSDGKCTTLSLFLPPYGSEVIVFRPGSIHQSTNRITGATNIDISSDWKVTFERLHKTVDMPKLTSWTDNAETEFYSGTAIYEKTVTIPESMAKRVSVQLGFGQGEPMPPSPMPNGMRALLESPVRESALVYVNGQLAGSVWHPPYALPIGTFLHAGQNQFRIVVANLAINEMAGKALPTYTLLKDRYGDRFQPQGFENFRSLPAGMLGPVHLMSIPK
jgi:alpha-L-rhamnosidase